MGNEIIAKCIRNPKGVQYIGGPIKGETYTVRMVTKYGFIIGDKLYLEHKPRAWSKDLFEYNEELNYKLIDTNKGAFNGLYIHMQRHYNKFFFGLDSNQKRSAAWKMIKRFLIENDLPCDKKQPKGIYCKNSETAQKHFNLFSNWCKFNLIANH